MERFEVRDGKVRLAYHRHSCPSCGERSGPCVDSCLERCGCIGKPRCMHFLCPRCRDHAVVQHFHVVVLEDQYEQANS